jgi:death-on-curing protein
VSEDLEPAFLSTASVFDIHASVITREESRDFDFDKLDSAVRATESYASYGEPEDLFDLAAAYAFYISNAHAFIAGNKRTAVVACLVFLKLNGVPTNVYSDDELFEWTIGLVDKSVGREEFAERLRGPFEGAGETD